VTSFARILIFALALSSLALFGCVKKPYQSEVCTQPDKNGCIIEDVAIQGSPGVPPSDVKEKIATTETNRILGGSMENVPIISIWDRLTVEYGKLDPFVLERDLARVERYYRARGYYEAHARAGRVVKKPDGKIRVEIAVDEGPPVKMVKVILAWKDLDKEKAVKVYGPVNSAEGQLLKRGARFEEDPYEQTKKLLQRAMTDHGFAYAEVDGKVDVDLVKHEAVVTYTLTLGPLCTFGPIKFAGLGDLPEPIFRTSLDIKEGDEYSTAKLDSSQIVLANFGVLGAIDVVSETSPTGQPRNPSVPVTFKAQKTQLHTARAGAGVQIGSIVEAHGIVGWEHRNLFGGLRHFTVDLEPGFIFYPLNINNIFTEAPTHVLPQALLRTELKEPLWFSPRTVGVIGASANFYRLQTADTVNQIPINYTETTNAFGLPVLNRLEENIVGYRELAGRVGAERSFWDNRQYVGAFYNIQFDNPFSYNYPEPLPGYVNLTISYVDFIGTVDLRRNADGKLDKLHPNKGVYLSNDFQIAGLGGNVQDFRIRPEFRGYIPITKKVTLAYRAVFGLLFPQNYGKTLDAQFPKCLDANSAKNEANTEARARDLQIFQFRAFFSGGPSSNRGYPYNGVGPQDDAHYVTQNAPCGELRIATGGLSLWEQSLELRFPLIGKAGGVLFFDGSDVNRERTFVLTSPHISTGLGFRYDTPVGPFRLDFGYRIPCLQVLGICKFDGAISEGQGSFLPLSTTDGKTKGIPKDLPYGVPFALAISIGEAF
jgi:outer membrane protein assembly factor BamA